MRRADGEPRSLRGIQRGLCALALAIVSTLAIAGPAAANEAAAAGQAADDAPAPEPEGYWTGPMNGPVPATLQGGKVIQLTELLTLLNHGHAVTVDVSNLPQKPEGLSPDSPWMPMPQRVIPGSLWIPGAGMSKVQPAVEKLFRKRLAMATSNNPTYPVVIYCHERCWLSWNAAKRAISYGYRNVYWFPDGIEGWQAAGHPTVVAKPLQPATKTVGASAQ